MPMILQPNQMLPYAMPVLVGWVLYRRVRRNFGPQAWKPKRTWFRLVLIALVALMLAVAAVFVPHALLPMAGGAAVGGVLGWIGLRHTHAEWRDGVRTYIPNPWVGGLLTLALVVRMIWRFTHGGGMQGVQQQPSVLTMAIAAALVAYTLYYSIGLIRRMRELGEHPPQA
ncbi:hypothetical protein H9L17_02980 [Thermomonas brevis]|uniref:DUF1453 domain-containing protein n=1 Tax=Thermomonas brevis TaxID=215691 RepID=A0A7G9QUW2_9GAMM|nr:hypothetical protein [Thermomonas brevis]QNN47137.1 hypothetical protein H9L17_02980 [Thermomonas brevis]